ncbi:DUF349 domain-containing protein [Maribacter algarum]|uniref:DUF349 domain-containing protein n=1 Tax=Maribacter algarum (ex Zhang et al. 2020) TaxID=2578118 RepID=A0A5S3PI31_9FLAO|nr:DUF349 domain-containing protein [Maribacter algarum]TMM53919.1 DUF349 domain-containing protein [Maribacter algarum]
MPEEKEQELQESVVENVEVKATEKPPIEGGEFTEVPKDEVVLNLENSKEKQKEEKAVEEESAPENDTSTEDKVVEEIDQSNAEDAEDTDNHHRHHIPILDYHSMSIENLTGELQRLVKNEKVQAIKKHVDGIKHEFDLKFQEFIDHKKEDFIANGGNEIDFRYNSVTKKQFNEVYSEYRENRNQYYRNLEKSLKENLAKRLELIEQLKGLINVEEDINTTYKNFKNLQEQWRNAGPIPRTDYNNVWKTYHHHIEIFYDFLHINRELRDLDFKHNLEEKQKLVVKAEALAHEPDLGKAFRELQTLHKIWKEDIGPVGKEHREQIWELFSAATKVLHQRRQEYYKDLDKAYEENLVKKQEIISAITGISENVADNHKALQLQMKQIEEHRNAFFKAGKVPQKVNEKTWAEFKEAVRKFNRNKNAFYKNLKKDQQDNLDKKRALLDLAVSLKDSEDWDVATQEMKRIQSEWKKIGHVPRKYSDKIWKEFKSACNHYFDRLHALKNEANKEEAENFTKKEACLERLKAFQLSGKREEDLSTIKSFIEEWKTIGRVPFNKKNITQKFNKILDAIFRKLDVSRQESELLKYGNKIQQLAKADDNRAISNERTFIRRKIEESKTEIRQLENNLQFFSNASEDNPLVKDVIKRVETHKQSLETWKAKLKNLNIMENNRNKEAEEVTEEKASSEEE